jgi:hypothetical protein
MPEIDSACSKTVASSVVSGPSKGPTKSPIGRHKKGAIGTGAISDEPDVDGLRSLAALDHVDGYPLAFRQIGEAAAIERRGMHENVLAAAVPDDEPKPLIAVVPFDRAELLDGGLI